MPKKIILLLTMTVIVLAGLITALTHYNLTEHEITALSSGAAAMVVGAWMYVIAYMHKGWTKRRSLQWSFGSMLILGAPGWIFIMASCITASYVVR